MITAPRGMAMIRNGHGVPVAFEKAWLKAALDRAARRAGYDEWWLLDEFSATVSQFLCQGTAGSELELRNLERVVRGALRDIGYREIAVRFRALNPFQHISLADFLAAPGGKQETVFLKRLGDRIEKLHAARVQQFHFYDLRPCVQRLLGNDTTSAWWSESLLQVHIVSFIRSKLRKLAWQSQMQCSIR